MKVNTVVRLSQYMTSWLPFSSGNIIFYAFNSQCESHFITYVCFCCTNSWYFVNFMSNFMSNIFVNQIWSGDTLFSCPEQLNRGPCHSLSEWVSEVSEWVSNLLILTYREWVTTRFLHYKERPMRHVTFEKIDQSDGETQESYGRHYTLFYIDVFRITLFRHDSENWKFTLMSSEFGENCPYFCDFSRIFAILPVYLWFCPYFCYLATVRASVSSCSCWFTHLQNVARCI